MAFDLDDNTLSTPSGHLEVANADPYRAAMLAGACASIAYRVTEWWDHRALPFEEVFREVQPFAADEETEASPEDVATFLLLVRAALRE